MLDCTTALVLLLVLLLYHSRRLLNACTYCVVTRIVLFSLLFSLLIFDLFDFRTHLKNKIIPFIFSSIINNNSTTTTAAAAACCSPTMEWVCIIGT